MVGFNKKPGPTSLLVGGHGPWMSRKLLAHELVGAVPAAGMEQATVAMPDCRIRIRLGKWRCGWRLMVNGGISDWRLGAEKWRKRLRREKKETTGVSASHFLMHEFVEEQNGYTDQKKAFREETRTVPGKVRQKAVCVKGERLWQVTGKELRPAGQGGQSKA